jgi:methyltransferase
VIRFVVCAAMAAARLFEVWRSRANMRASGATEEGVWSRRTFPLIVAVHTIVIAGTFLRGTQRPRMPWLLALIAMQPLRLSVLRLLGSRWNVRGAVPHELRIETRGPYAVIRHPNYAVIIVELFALPLAFGLPSLALAATAANAALLAIRIREEEQALMRIPEYRAHFEHKRRLIPGVF